MQNKISIWSLQNILALQLQNKGAVKEMIVMEKKAPILSFCVLNYCTSVPQSAEIPLHICCCLVAVVSSPS